MGKAGSFDPQKMLPFFPAVGILIGLGVAIFDRIALNFWNEPVVALLDVALLAMVTGAFHLDGLGDTADGLFSHRSKESALAIMKDSRLGTMGMVAIVFGLALKWAGITGLADDRSLVLIMVPAYARGGVLFGFRYLKYGRPGGGIGLEFFQKALPKSAFWGLGLSVILSCTLGWKGLWLNLAFGVITASILWYYQKRLGCVTGDMLGAMIETTESALFLLLSMGG